MHSAELTAYPAILDRPEAIANVNKHFADTVRVLGELTDYGTHLIPRCWRASDRRVTDSVVLLVLLKQAVGLLDASHVLLTAGVVAPSLLPLRAFFEASVYLQFVLRRDTERRARAYYVANLRKRRMWALRGQKSSIEHEAFRADFKQLATKNPFKDRQDEIAAELAIVNARLNKRDLRQMNLAFDRRRGKGKFDPDWYAVLFPRKQKASPYTLARILKCRADYRIIYEQGSEMMHSSRMDTHVRSETDGLRIRSLRELTDFPLIAQLLMGQALKLYTLILEGYRPAERENFARKYVEEWRAQYLSQVSIKYNYIEHVLDL